MKEGQFWIYMLLCENGSYYTGYAVNLVRRYWQHVNGRGNARYTGSFRPVALACCWRLRDTKGTALRLEHLVRSRSHADKEYLAANPSLLVDLARDYLGRGIPLESFDPSLIEEAVARCEREPRVEPFPF